MQRSTPPETPADEDWTRLGERPLPAPVVADGIAARRAVVYASPEGFRPLEIDVYAPAATTAPLPAIMWIHGGAFALGTRALPPAFLQQLDFFAVLVREGFVVASVDYRLSGEARWPAQLTDVRCAVRWLRDNAAELGIDPSAIAVWGESAGAHLAAMAGVLGRSERPEEHPGLALPEVAAVVDWYGPTNFRLMDGQAPPGGMVHDAADSPESRLLGAPVQEAGALVDDADPSSHVTADAPPFLIRHGTRDRLVPFGQSEVLARRLADAGVDVTFLPVEGADHVFDGYDARAGLVDEAIGFLRRVLPSSAVAPSPSVHTKGTS